MNGVKSKGLYSKVKHEGESPKKKRRNNEATSKKFPPGQLRTLLLPVWGGINKQVEAIPFRQPVDAEALNIPDYYTIITRPMDLSTIKEKLIHGDYCNPWDFCEDMWLMFENAWTYNKRTSQVYKCANKLAEKFETDVDPVMKQLGFCCGRSLYFTPLPLICHGSNWCMIPRFKIYHSYMISTNENGIGNVEEEYNFCQKCFKELPEEVDLTKNNPTTSETKNTVNKSLFKIKMNDDVEMEPFVSCTRCKRLWHKICALFNENIECRGFVCQHCLLEDGEEQPINRFTAKTLGSCELSDYLEKRVNKYLSEAKAESGEVIIRVASVFSKEMHVKPLMKERFCGEGEMPARIPFRVKEIYAFQVIEGAEVCFFSFHVQEYASPTYPPNYKHVYISYMDSVNFFQPREERTNVYYELLLAYMDYAKNLGYLHLHLWACPPGPGDDYIFHCHPPKQKVPDVARLQEWYKCLLDKAIIRRIIADYKNLYKQLKVDKIDHVTKLPYFDGDFLPTILEQLLKEEKTAEEAKKANEERMTRIAEIQNDVFTSNETPPQTSATPEPEVTPKQVKKKTPGRKKKNWRKNNLPNRVRSSSSSEIKKPLFQRVLSRIELHKEVFFVIRLQPVFSKAESTDILDPDSLMSSVLMDGRDMFLARSREEHWEFCNLRRAKYSTMAITHAIHMERINPDLTCTNCDSSASTTMWKCDQCKEFWLCQRCHGESKHEHHMEPINLASKPQSSFWSPSKSHPVTVQQLQHAVQCSKTECDCSSMKARIKHARKCDRPVSGCMECSQVSELSRLHAKRCVAKICPVPFCNSIREKQKKRQEALRRQGDWMMMRRMNGIIKKEENEQGSMTPLAVVSEQKGNPAGASSSNSIRSMISQMPSLSASPVVRQLSYPSRNNG